MDLTDAEKLRRAAIVEDRKQRTIRSPILQHDKGTPLCAVVTHYGSRVGAECRGIALLYTDGFGLDVLRTHAEMFNATPDFIVRNFDTPYHLSFTVNHTDDGGLGTEPDEVVVNVNNETNMALLPAMMRAGILEPIRAAVGRDGEPQLKLSEKHGFPVFRLLVPRDVWLFDSQARIDEHSADLEAFHERANRSQSAGTTYGGETVHTV